MTQTSKQSPQDRIREASREYRWSQLIQPGVIVDDNGHSFPVERFTEKYNTVEYWSNGRTMTVPYGERIEILGYFNP